MKKFPVLFLAILLGVSLTSPRADGGSDDSAQ